MINGFKKETHELTDYELTLIPLMVNGLKTKIGEINAIKNKEMVAALKSLGHKVSEARIRKLIHYIRVKRLVKNIIATSKGYYIATTEEEIKSFVESLQQRINSIEEVKNSFSL